MGNGLREDPREMVQQGQLYKHHKFIEKTPPKQKIHYISGFFVSWVPHFSFLLGAALRTTADIH